MDWSTGSSRVDVSILPKTKEDPSFEMLRFFRLFLKNFQQMMDKTQSKESCNVIAKGIQRIILIISYFTS
jgi:hypothetical protein